MSGFTFLFVIGKPCWPRLEITKGFFRLVIGPFGLWLMLYDLDLVFGRVIHRLEKAEAALAGKEES